MVKADHTIQVPPPATPTGRENLQRASFSLSQFTPSESFFFPAATRQLCLDRIDFSPAYFSAQSCLSLSFSLSYTHNLSLSLSLSHARTHTHTTPRLTCSRPPSLALFSQPAYRGQCWSSAIYTPSCLLSSCLLISHERGLTIRGIR